MTLSFDVVLPVYNESRRCERVFDYYNAFCRVIVIDNCSSDNTLALLRRAGASRIYTLNNNGTIQSADWFRKVIEWVSTPYFLVASCSEICPPPLMRKFDEISSSGDNSIVGACVETYNCGYSYNIDGGLVTRKKHIGQRLFHKEHLDIDSIRIHMPYYPRASSTKPILIIPPSPGLQIVHLRDCDVRTLTLKHLDYALVEASECNALSGRQILALTFIKVFREFAKLLQNNPKHWRYPLIRDISSRILLHLFVAFRTFEIKTGNTLEASQLANSRIWSAYATLDPDRAY